MSFSGLLDTTVSVIRQTGADDGQGGQTMTDVILLRSVPCRFESLSGSKAQITYSKLTPLPDFIVYMEYQAILKEGDKLADIRGRQYGIALIEDWSMAGRFLKIAVTQLKKGE